MNIFKMKDKFDRTYYFLKLFSIIFISMIFVEEMFKLFAFGNVLGLEQVRLIVFCFNTSIVLSLVLSLLKEKISKVILLIFIFFDAFYALVQLTFNRMFNNYMSLSASNNGGLTRVLPQIKEFIKTIDLTHLILFIPFFMFLILIIKNKVVLKYERQNKIRLSLYVLIVIISILLSYLSISLNFLQNKNQIRTNKELYFSPTLVDVSIKEFGIFRFFERDLINMFIKSDSYELEPVSYNKQENNEKEETDYSRKIDDSKFKEIIADEKNKEILELHNYFINQPIPDKNKYTGIFKDKNLVLIMVEAFDMIAINEQLTPTLYELATNGMYFSQYYTPKYSCTTGESEYIAETSLIPSSLVCTPNTYINNKYSTTIFNIFNNNGYYSSSYHSWTDEFYTRSKLHPNMGSQLYQDYTSLNMSKIIGWPLDSEMVENSYTNYIDKDKFFTFYITSSTHFPYDEDTTVTRKHWDKVKDTSYPMEVKRYLAKAIELDSMLETLINKLSDNGILDDTVIVLFGDHHPLKISQTYLNKYSKIDRFKDFNMDKLPFIIYNSKIEPENITKVSSTFDILPTLANMFDLDYDPRYYMGNDIFSDSENIVIFTNGSWITDKCLYDSRTNNYKSLTDEEVSNEYITSINKKVNDKFYVSNKVLELDYFKYRNDLTNN